MRWSVKKAGEKFRGNCFEAFDDRVGFIEQFGGMGIGDGKTLHGCAARAFDAFFGVFDD
jgi:hypothetical protein